MTLEFIQIALFTHTHIHTHSHTHTPIHTHTLSLARPMDSFIWALMAGKHASKAEAHPTSARAALISAMAENAAPLRVRQRSDVDVVACNSIKAHVVQTSSKQLTCSKPECLHQKNRIPHPAAQQRTQRKWRALCYIITRIAWIADAYSTCSVPVQPRNH